MRDAELEAQRARLDADMVRRNADRAALARAEVIAELRKLRTLRVADVAAGQHWRTPEADAGTLTVTMSVRQAIALVRILGPINDLRSSGPEARLFAAITVTQRQVSHAFDRHGPGVRAALQVLRVAVDDYLAYCAAPPRRPRRLPTRPATGGGADLR